MDSAADSAAGVRKPPKEETAREGTYGGAAGAYGDLGAAGELADLDRADATSCLTVGRAMDER